MVDAVTPISSTAPTAPTRVGESHSIASEPDNAWVAALQSRMNDALSARTGHPGQAGQAEPQDEPAAETPIPGLAHADPDAAGQHHSGSGGAASGDDRDGADADAGLDDTTRLSGESERIGSVNFEPDTPFGSRTAIV